MSSPACSTATTDRKASWQLERIRLPHTLNTAGIAGTERREVLSCLRKAETSIRTSSNDGRVIVVLFVVLPVADRTDFIPAALREGEIAAAGARKTRLLRGDDVGRRIHIKNGPMVSDGCWPPAGSAHS